MGSFDIGRHCQVGALSIEQLLAEKITTRTSPTEVALLSSAQAKGNHFYGHPIPPTVYFSTPLVEIVVVTGSAPNMAGHALLNVGGLNYGQYFHLGSSRLDTNYNFKEGFYDFIKNIKKVLFFDMINARPSVLYGSEYRAYLTLHDKMELFRIRVYLSNPAGSVAKLREIAGQPWFWKVAWNNCYTFCQNIIEAGSPMSSVSYYTPLLDMQLPTSAGKALGQKC